MKKQTSTKTETPSIDIAALITAMQQQLATLERKVDILVSRAPSPAAQSAPRPFAPSGQPQQRPPEPRQDNGFRDRILYKAVCADCSKPCEVPFKPSGDRPVYCKECFAKRRNGGVPKVRPAAMHPPTGQVPARPVDRQAPVVAPPAAAKPETKPAVKPAKKAAAKKKPAAKKKKK